MKPPWYSLITLDLPARVIWHKGTLTPTFAANPLIILVLDYECRRANSFGIFLWRLIVPACSSQASQYRCRVGRRRCIRSSKPCDLIMTHLTGVGVSRPASYYYGKSFGIFQLQIRAGSTYFLESFRPATSHGTFKNDGRPCCEAV